MTKTLSYQVIEDNGGGLHLAIFDGDSCIWYASGYEYIPDNLREDIAALQDGADPLQDGWESYLPDSYTPQQLYDELTSYEYGWAVVADDEGIYYDRMGAAATTALAIPWQDLVLLNADNQDVTDPDEIRRALAEFREHESINRYFFRRIGAPHEDPEDASTWGPQSPEHVDWTDFPA
jgi:hypothetical protein